MKVAYCVICHKRTKILDEMINILGDDNDIFIHVDKKSNIKEFSDLSKKVTLIKDRVRVQWAGFSQVKATLKLLNYTNNNNYDYIFLLSGDCLPLKSSDSIKKFLIENNGKEFIGVVKNNNIEEEIEKRLKYNYSYIYFNKNKNNIVQKVIAIKEKYNLYTKNKYFKYLPKIYKGCNWIGITGDFCSYIFQYLDENPTYIKAFKKCIYGDEEFFQTIIMNSEYKKNIYKYEIENDDCSMALRYIDWSTGPNYPRILDESDFIKIKDSNCLFGRKFNEKININEYRKMFID